MQMFPHVRKAGARSNDMVLDAIWMNCFWITKPFKRLYFEVWKIFPGPVLEPVLFGHGPKFVWNDRNKLSYFGQNVLKYRLMNTDTASFNATVRQTTEMSQRRKKQTRMQVFLGGTLVFRGVVGQLFDKGKVDLSVICEKTATKLPSHGTAIKKTLLRHGLSLANNACPAHRLVNTPTFIRFAIATVTSETRPVFKGRTFCAQYRLSCSSSCCFRHEGCWTAADFFLSITWWCRGEAR